MNENDNEEYVNYLFANIGFLSEETLYDLNISYEQYMNPDENTIQKLENYYDNKKNNRN